ncbi:CopG family ribbon-helix-helix protein [Sinorhizobium meliloti]|uniref:CopG family ribbon-helix-helix protein n=1 Tax=Rhizobium meliloti TaxID=382 RepID=UPI001F4720A1|nr:hypothetical protein [Sinorhizobium meliloti]
MPAVVQNSKKAKAGCPGFLAVQICSCSCPVKQALTAWVDQEEERRRLTVEALAYIDSGRVIEHQAVQAWADSLDSDKPLPLPL